MGDGFLDFEIGGSMAIVVFIGYAVDGGVARSAGNGACPVGLVFEGV